MQLPILVEHARLLAVDKPAGLVVVPARREDPADSLWRALERERSERLWVVHRLDRDTSGVVVLARDAGAHRTLSMAFEHRQVEKTYMALTRGLPPAAQGRIETPLHAARRGKMRPAHPGEAGALASVTDYRLLRSWPGLPVGPVGLVELQPRTGRPHQIRVHLRSVGAPLLVDPLYGGARSVGAVELGLAGSVFCGRLTLHAARLIVPNPDGGDPLDLQAPLAADLQALLDGLEFGLI